MEGCFWQYNQHLPIRIQQEIEEREVNWLQVNKKVRNARRVFTKLELISQLVLVFLVNK